MRSNTGIRPSFFLVILVEDTKHISPSKTMETSNLYSLYFLPFNMAS